MGVTSTTCWYGVCDKCGERDDDGRPTEREARDRMWSENGRELCWGCIVSLQPVE